MKIVFHFFFLASSKEIIESCVFCSKMDVEFSPPFVSFDLHEKDPAGFQGRHSAESFFFFFSFQNQFELCARHCRYKDEKEAPESNRREEYMPRKHFQRSSKFGLRKVGKVFLAK